MKCVLLDRESLDIGDLDFRRLDATCPHWVSYNETLPEVLPERVRNAEILICNKVILGENELKQAPSLKLVCVSATGTNNIDLAAARALGISVCNVRAYATPSVVEHVFAMLLSLSRKLHEHHRAAIDGHWMASRQFCVLDYPISELHGKTMGIIGFGELGSAVARVAECLGMRVLLAQRPGDSTLREGRIPLHELLPQVDVLSLHCPLDVNTRNLIGAREFSLMKPGAILINTARGGIVDEAALAQALREGKLGAAATDVLHEEPPRHGNLLLDESIPHLLVTPHVAWASSESRQRLLDEVIENIHAFIQGKPRNLV